MRKEIHQSKCEEWEKLIDQWIGSGLSKKQWCNENNINVRQLRYWQRVLKREVTGQNDSDNSGGQGCDTNEPADTASLVYRKEFGNISGFSFAESISSVMQIKLYF